MQALSTHLESNLSEKMDEILDNRLRYIVPPFSEISRCNKATCTVGLSTTVDIGTLTPCASMDCDISPDFSFGLTPSGNTATKEDFTSVTPAGSLLADLVAADPNFNQPGLISPCSLPEDNIDEWATVNGLATLFTDFGLTNLFPDVLPAISGKKKSSRKKPSLHKPSRPVSSHPTIRWRFEEETHNKFQQFISHQTRSQ